MGEDVHDDVSGEERCPSQCNCETDPQSFESKLGSNEAECESDRKAEDVVCCEIDESSEGCSTSSPQETSVRA